MLCFVPFFQAACWYKKKKQNNAKASLRDIHRLLHCHSKHLIWFSFHQDLNPNKQKSTLPSSAIATQKKFVLRYPAPTQFYSSANYLQLSQSCRSDFRKTHQLLGMKIRILEPIAINKNNLVFPLKMRQLTKSNHLQSKAHQHQKAIKRSSIGVKQQNHYIEAKHMQIETKAPGKKAKKWNFASESDQIHERKFKIRRSVKCSSPGSNGIV